jgi:hypothetical protein
MIPLIKFRRTHAWATRPKPAQGNQNFLTLWKDADPDIPILKQAKAEYAQLQKKSQ